MRVSQHMFLQAVQTAELAFLTRSEVQLWLSLEMRTFVPAESGDQKRTLQIHAQLTPICSTSTLQQLRQWHFPPAKASYAVQDKGMNLHSLGSPDHANLFDLSHVHSGPLQAGARLNCKLRKGEAIHRLHSGSNHVVPLALQMGMAWLSQHTKAAGRWCKATSARAAITKSEQQAQHAPQW